MITVKLQGGLGNQLFQYAFGRATSERFKTKLKLHTSFYHKSENRKFILDRFNIEAGVEKSTFLELTTRLGLREITKEKEVGFDTKLEISDNKYYEGYWQTEKYFESVKNSLREELTLKDPLSTQTREMLKRVHTENSVSVHVRRGDYVAVEKIRKVHGLLDATYYQKALSQITKKIPSPTLFIFSDDIKWVKTNLKFPYPTEYVSDLGLPEYEELFIMSACRHHIIANSSFSWWGAWLDTRPDKTIIAPKNWFADTSKDSADIVPKNWIKI